MDYQPRGKYDQRQQRRTRSPQPVILYDLDLEAQIIGAVLNENRNWNRCASLTPEMFSDYLYSQLWHTISERLAQGKSVNPGSLGGAVNAITEDQNGRQILSDLSAYAETIDQEAIPDAVSRIMELSQWRKLYQCKQEIERILEQPQGKADRYFSQMIDILQAGIQSGGNTSRTKRQVIQNIRNTYTRPNDPTPTGIEPLDIIFQGGLVSGRSYGIGAPYGRGKTILVGSISDNLNHSGEMHLVITVETPPEDIEVRNAARHMQLNATQITDGTNTHHRQFLQNIENYEQAIEDNTIYEYAPGIDIDGVIRLIRSHIYRNKIKGVIIDYLQVIGGRERGQNTPDHLNSMGNRINALCRQEGIWSVIMVQAEEGRSQPELDQIRKPLSIFVRMQRDPNETGIIFITEKNNYGKLTTSGTESQPAAIFDMVGPHIRTPTGVDYATMTPPQE